MRALTVALALLLAGAPTASAGGMNGLLVSNIDVNCYSLTTGNPYSEPMISAIAGWVSDSEIAEGGKPFTAEFSVGVVGLSCSGAEISPTVIPPVGVRIAADATHPVQWRYPDTSQAWQTRGVKLLPLADGTTKIIATSQPDHSTWPIANERAPLQFRVPLIADRELRGAGSPPGQCPNGPPCAPSEAGDFLQVKIDTSIGTPLVLTPVVALFATAPPPAAATGMAAPSSARASAFAKGLAIKVNAAKGAKLAIAVTAMSGKRLVTIAKGSATAKLAGQTTVKVKRTRAGKALIGTRTLKATVVLTGSGPGLSTVEKRAALTVRR